MHLLAERYKRLPEKRAELGGARMDMTGEASGLFSSASLAASAGVGGPTIELRKPEGQLLPLIERYYLCRWDSGTIEGVERVDVGQMRFVMKGSGQVTFPDSHVEKVKPIMVSGPGTAANAYRLEGPFHCFGVSMRAIGWKRLIGVPANKVTDHIIDGSKLFCERAGMLLDRLKELDTIDEMIAAIEPLLIDRQEEVRPVPQAHIVFARIVREWAASESPVIQTLYDSAEEQAGIGQRQVMRLCNEYFGGPPKHLERKFRAIGAAMRLYHGAALDDVLDDFYDQSHLINEIKHFTGHTPTSLRSGIDPIVALSLDNETFHFLPEVIPETVDVGAR